MSSKKKRLAGRLAKYVICDSGSCAFAKRADKRAISKTKNSGPLDVEPISALVETACVDLEVDGEGDGNARQLCSVSVPNCGFSTDDHQRDERCRSKESTQAQEREDVETTPTQLTAESTH